MNTQNIIEQLLSFKAKYHLAENQWLPLEDSIKRLSTRYHDKSLYLGVVGEFSSGKSTLINALLGYQLLKEDSLQGTTCAPTFLRYGKNFDVIIEYVNQPIQILSETPEFRKPYTQILDWFEKVRNSQNHGTIRIPKELSSIQQFIDKNTADEQTAKNIIRTTIYLDSPLLKTGVVIVDTPGINATNTRHSMVAEYAIKEYCDAVLLLVPSTTPCSETLCTFVRNHLQGIQCSSIVILTKADMIRERELSRTLNHVKTRLESETDTKFAATFLCAAYYGLNYDPEARISQEKQEEFRIQFYAMVQKILAHLNISRNTIITRKLTLILQNLIPQMRAHIHQKQNEYQEKVTTLKNNQLKNLSGYIATQRNEFLTRFNRIYVPYTTYEDMMQQDLFAWLDWETSQAESNEQLKEIADLFSSIINQEWGFVCEDIDEGCKVFFNQAKDFCVKMQREFNREYRNLCKNYSQIIPSSTSLQDVQQVQIQQFSKALELAETFTAKEDKLLQGGAVAGIALGTLICPGLGSVIGGFLGLIGGALFVDQDKVNLEMANELKKEYKLNIKSQIRFFISERIETHKRAAKQIVEDWFVSLVQQYGRQINQLIQNEQDEQEQLKSKIYEAEYDLGRLESWEKETSIGQENRYSFVVETGFEYSRIVDN